jgi:hypothetical protein
MSKVVQKMMEDAAKQAMEITAQIFGMETETVAKILRVGLPMQMKFISENSDMVKQMYKEVFAMMPEEVQAFYRDLAGDEAAVDKLIEDYKTFMGATVDAINDAVTEELDGVTDVDAMQTMATMQPAAKEAVKSEAEAAGVEDVESFGGWLRSEGEVI